MNNRYCTFDKYLLFNYHFERMVITGNAVGISYVVRAHYNNSTNNNIIIILSWPLTRPRSVRRAGDLRVCYSTNTSYKNV